ncbi:hypothetical protein HMPREF9058_1591 [Actinomyces sp. oral taxon 175 str. F0384]|nr:hypothetical protein HMPREF9058_1591 [Actinomyces sp. oral taxon 175 str. F0384]
MFDNSGSTRPRTMRRVVQVEDVQGHRSATRSVTPGDF